MRADRDRSCRAYAGQSQLELYVSNGPGTGASITGCQRVLPEEWLPADDLYHDGQRGRDQDRDVPVWCALIVRRAEYEVDGTGVVLNLVTRSGAGVSVSPRRESTQARPGNAFRERGCRTTPSAGR